MMIGEYMVCAFLMALNRNPVALEIFREAFLNLLRAQASRAGAQDG